ncbi:MAG: PAS domain-containing sensor histidine kinase [Gemmatimonadaceae bacterium]
MTQPTVSAAPKLPDAVLAVIATISADAIICLDESQRIIFYNQGAETIFGYRDQEVIGKPLEVLIPERFRAVHPSHVAEFGESPVQARRMGERRRIVGLRENGEEFPAEAAISHLVADGRKVYSVVLRDVTERHRAHATQRFLAEAGEILSASLGHEDTMRNVARLAVPVLADACIVNAFHKGEFIGTVAAHADPGRVAGIERQRAEHPIDVSGVHPVAEVIRTRLPIVWPGTNDGASTSAALLPEVLRLFDQAPVSAIITPLIAREQLVGVLEYYRERSAYNANDRFLAEELGRRAALAIDNARLYDLVNVGIRARDDMIGIVSHDLRNPVNAVRMLTSVMLKGDDEKLSPKIANYASLILQATEQMDGLIADLLDVTRVEAGRLAVDQRRENTEEMLSDALRTLAPVAQDKLLKLRLDAADDLPDVMADKSRFTQAISNLVGNAIRFSASGGEIMVRVLELDHQVLFSVSDSGRGMTPEELSHAFDRFWQSSRTDRQGAGLGLAIAKGIIEAHQGRIWAESRLGIGSTFYFTLPIAGELAPPIPG